MPGLRLTISRCIGCRSCEVACKRVHGGKGHVNVHMVGDHASVPIFCHHCEEATCTMACYTGALYKDAERTAFDVEKCTGCGLCQLACPFGVVWSEQDSAQVRPVCWARDSTCIISCPANALSTDFALASSRARARAAMAVARGR